MGTMRVKLIKRISRIGRYYCLLIVLMACATWIASFVQDAKASTHLDSNHIHSTYHISVSQNFFGWIHLTPSPEDYDAMNSSARKVPVWILHRAAYLFSLFYLY